MMTNSTSLSALAVLVILILKFEIVSKFDIRILYR